MNGVMHVDKPRQRKERHKGFTWNL